MRHISIFLLGLLLFRATPAPALIDDGRAGDPGELFLALLDADAQRSYYKDLGITMADFLQNPAARFDLSQDAAYAEFLGKSGLAYNIAAVYPLRGDLANVNTWGYLSTSDDGPDIFSAGFFDIQDVYQRIQSYLSHLNPAPFGGTPEERQQLRAENLSGAFGPEDAGYFDAEGWGSDLGQGVGGNTTGTPDRPLAFYRISNYTGDRNGEVVEKLGSWLLSANGLLRFTTGEEINQPPEADAGFEQRVSPGVQVTLNAGGSSDPDGDALSYLWAWQSGPVRIEPAGAADTPAWSFTAPDQTGVYVFRLTVSDGVHQATAETRVRVETAAANLPPTAQAGADRTVVAGTEVLLDGGASVDPDAGPQALSHLWAWSGGPSPVDPQPTSVAGVASFAAPTQAGEYAFELTVSDGMASSSDTVLIRVEPPPVVLNLPPIADPGPDRVVNQGDGVTLDGSASQDPEGSPLGFAWRQSAGPKVNLRASASVTASFQAGQAGAYGFELTVSDGERKASRAVNILVNAPPVANAGSDRTVLPGRRVALDGAASSDPDGVPAPLRHAWTQTQGPPVELAGADGAQASFTPVELGTYAFRLSVHDGAAGNSTGLLVTVQPIRLDAPEIWKADQSGVIAWDIVHPGKRRVRIQFARDGVSFATLATARATRGNLRWTPKHRHATHRGVLRVCLSGSPRKPPLCDAAGVVVQP